MSQFHCAFATIGVFWAEANKALAFGVTKGLYDYFNFRGTHVDEID